jgi:prepilin-type N-terminal cleavage/methylation domain-containing protein
LLTFVEVLINNCFKDSVVSISKTVFKHHAKPISSQGFTLAELLIALGILGVLATFTIPKILQTMANNQRYTKAIDTYAAIAGVFDVGVLQNSGCFPGNSMPCKINSSTGAILDGNSAGSIIGHPSYDDTANYLDTHLNYARKAVYSSKVYYYLHNGTTVLLNSTGVPKINPSQYEVYIYLVIYIDATPEDVQAGNISQKGVDTQTAGLRIFKNRMSFPGDNNYRLRIGSGYAATSASVFDRDSHPSDTCVAVSGTNCGL